ncbi:purple acid phosphatase family protein [Algoriphagus sp. PAP.12]|uniref:purple acid phosphatase family protein n=1 Tax=Algoriphagus sp. PAP.12 TaxID=2996678 RepID=UPI00227C143F|nr:metallophosphoesterase family protein [Algoriphagus sp. PAP.12]
MACQPEETKPSPSLEETMDWVITKFYAEFSPGELKSADQNFFLSNLSSEELKVLSTQFWKFQVNEPVIVSLMIDVDQEVIPFWVEESGFQKTDLQVTNEMYTYNVWRKEFPEGMVELGIPGIENHRTPYFVSVGKADKESDRPLEISNVFPAYQELQSLEIGNPVYTCWDLKLEQYPKELEGDILLATNRGRPREAHLFQAIRETNFPSKGSPDQIALSWNGDPKTSMNIQWRTSLAISDNKLTYWEKGSDSVQVQSSVKELYDRLVYGDSRVNHHTVELKNLSPGTTYFYQIESGNHLSEVYSFKTEPEKGEFSFIWFGDTHNQKDWGELIQEAVRRNPETAFISFTGDMVDHGLYRNEWDDFFGYSGNVFSTTPVMPIPGNHENQDDLGNQLYYDLWSLPKNAPAGTPEESSYSFKYQNAFFLMIDATQEIDQITPWIEEQMKNSDSEWKIVMLHFPPYNWETSYPDIISQWVPLFDQYHVDLALSGHKHYYMRSFPLNNGEQVDNFSQGTVYVLSTGTGYNPTPIDAEEPYAFYRENKSHYYQRVEIDENRLDFKTYNGDGNVVDEFVIRK